MTENQKCILVIDDEDSFCQVVKTRFEHWGYKVLIAHEGGEGFKQTEEGKPDCVLLDIRIPKGESGLSYLHKLRSYRHEDLQEQTRIRKTPVIVLTGAGTEMQPLFELEGISGFIEKPFDFANLKTKIEHVLRVR